MAFVSVALPACDEAETSALSTQPGSLLDAQEPSSTPSEAQSDRATLAAPVVHARPRPGHPDKALAAFLPTREPTRRQAPRAATIASSDVCTTLAFTEACRNYDAQRYTLRGRIDWSRQKLLARETIEVTLLDRRHAVIDLDAATAIARVHANGVDLPYAIDVEEQILRVDLATLARRTIHCSFTVEYQASVGTGLNIPAISSLDPVKGKIAFTFSEPASGKEWLVANHHPADRAAFAIEMEVDDGDDLVANGQRIRDRRCGLYRCVGYRIEEPNPTYLMAFALGDLVRVEHKRGKVPLQLWHRRGLKVDAPALFAATEKSMNHFTRLLGPYPWSHYSIVLLPAFPGGMEHTTISFLSEGYMATPDWFIFPHELAHHWFGNWVTIATWDDLWIKEGMASLLEAEAFRYRLDEGHSGNLLGQEFFVDPNDAIRDRELQGFAKYTSGPYGRAAWLLTQIRHKVGEHAFWATLRRVLRDHALGAIDSETFVQSFAPALDPSSVEAAIHALDLHRGPEVSYDVMPKDQGTRVTITLEDPDESMLVPADVSLIDAAGRRQTTTLVASQTQHFDVPPGGYIAPDERGIHSFFSAEAFPHLLLPTAQRALRTFERSSPSHQESALFLADNFPAIPRQASALMARLDSGDARYAAELQVCGILQSLPDDPSINAWIGEVADFFRTEHAAVFDPSYGPCGVDFAEQVFGEEFVEVATQPTAQNLGRLIYLANFDYGAAKTFKNLTPHVSDPTSRVTRDMAVYRLTSQVMEPFNYSPVDPSDSEPWRVLFRNTLAQEPAGYLIERLAQALGILHDRSALPLLADALIRVPMNSRQQVRVICGAYQASEGDAAAWEAFQVALQPWQRFTSSAQATLQNPAARCG